MNTGPLLVAMGAHKWLFVSALVIGAIVRLLKSDGPIPFTVPARARPWLALGLGLVSGALNAIATGTPWKQAALEGVVSGVVAILGHNVLVESMNSGKELPLPGGPPDRGALAFLFLLTAGSVSLAGCAWWAKKGPVVTPDAERIVLCILAHASEPLADIEEQCKGAEAQLIVDLVSAQRAAEAKAAERHAKAAGSATPAPSSSGSAKP